MHSLIQSLCVCLPIALQLAELRMFNSNGDNVAKKAKITLILNPKNPNDVAKIVLF